MTKYKYDPFAALAGMASTFACGASYARAFVASVSLGWLSLAKGK